MKKRGFTLIELLAVIIILGILAMVLVPIIQDLISNARYASAVNSALNYVDAANTQVVVDLGGFEEFSLRPSVNGILESGVNDSELDKIKYKGKGPTYIYLSFSNDGTHVKYARFCIWGYSINYSIKDGAVKSDTDYCNGDVVPSHYEVGAAVYYNVDTGKRCGEQAYKNNVYEWSKHANYLSVGDQMVPRGMGQVPDGLHTGCLKFYVLKDSNETLTLLTAFNINEFGPDKNETDSSKYGFRNAYWADIKEGATTQNVKDFNNITNPVSNTYYVMDLLKEYTKNWKTNPISEDYDYSYTYTVDDAEVTDSYTIPYKTEGYKTRLITKDELNEIMLSDKKSIIQDNTWEHEYPQTMDGSSRVSLSGFYTSDALSDTQIAVFNSYGSGSIDGIDGTSSSNKYGVRPVIEVNRDNLLDKETEPDPYCTDPSCDPGPDDPIIVDSFLPSSTSGSDSGIKPGTVFYFNVTTGTECTKGEAAANLSNRHTPVGVNSGCMKFYSLNDSSDKDTITLILDHPFSFDTVNWYSEAAALFGNYEKILPPMTLLSDLALNTQDWQGVETVKGDYKMSTLAGKEGEEQWYFETIIPYHTLGMKARIITTPEVDMILHKYPNYMKNYDSSNINKEFAQWRKMSGTLGARNDCGTGKNYDPNCDVYGTSGMPTAELAWLFNDYGSTGFMYSAVAEYTDFYGSANTGGSAVCGWTTSYSISDYRWNFYSGPFVVLMCNQTESQTPDAHTYRAIIEVKKDKFGGVVKDNDIEIVVGTTTNYSAGGTCTISDSTIASVDGSCNITGLKIGVTQVKSSNGHYAKVVVNHAPDTYYNDSKYAYYNPFTGTECNDALYNCTTSNRTCIRAEVIGETATGNYILKFGLWGIKGYSYSSSKWGWSPRYAIDDDATAETKYGAMAYSHWYKSLEYLANLTKDWVAAIPHDYVNYVTKEYTIPWSSPAYYENSNPVYTKVRFLNMEDANGMLTHRTDISSVGGLYEVLHDTGSFPIIKTAYPTSESMPTTATAYKSEADFASSYSSTSADLVMEVPKTSINKLYTYDDVYVIKTFISTNEYLDLNSQCTWTQSSTDGGEVNITSGGRITPKANGHVRVDGSCSDYYGTAYTITKNVVVDLQYSCGQVDACGNTTPTCN